MLFLVKEFLFILDIFESVILEVVDGRVEFTSTFEELVKLVRKYYVVCKNLLIKFIDDIIDEISVFVVMFVGVVVVEDIDFIVRTRKGDYVFSFWCDIGIDVLDEVYEVVE